MRERLRRLALLAAVAVVWFAVFETALRIHGGSEAAPAFQQLFMADAATGHRLRPGATTRYTTAEFSTSITINAQGVRDDDPIERKGPNERRVVVLGDSIVFAVQVDARATFCERLEALLNQRGDGRHYRVINAGVQGYGPAEIVRFFETVAGGFEPDLVLAATFVANDAVEALDRAWRLGDTRNAAERAADEAENRLRRVVRRSMVLQIARQRADQVIERVRPARQPLPDRRLLTYASPLRPDLVAGLDEARGAMARLAAGSAARGAKTALVLVPARFQLDAAEADRMKAEVTRFGLAFDVDGASRRFTAAYAPLSLPMTDLLGAFKAWPHPTRVFFERTVHLTPEGHDVAARALLQFIDQQALLP
jgi:hypothetical protein